MSGSFSLDEDDADKIVGDTDGTLIGNVNDRLKVTGRSIFIPDEDSVPSSTKFVNGATADMAVDGSVTPVVFTAGPTTTDEIWYATRIGFTIDDTGNIRRQDFGAISDGLTNGLLVQTTVNSTDHTITNLKNNAEMLVGFENLFRGQSNSYLNNNNFLSGSTFFTNPVILKESRSDEFKITVRDDLAGLDLLEVFLFYFRAV